MERAQGFAMQGARVVWTNGYSSSSLHQETAPYATITVYLTGTTVLATLYSDNQLPPTPMANPFTANQNGYWFFYAIDGRYDVRIDAVPWSWTIGDLLLQDPGRWTADQNANGHWLHNLGGIDFVSPNGQCHESIALDNNCNLIWTGPSGNQIMSLSPQGDLSVNSIRLGNPACDIQIWVDQNCTLTISAHGVPVAWLSTSTASGHPPGYLNLGFGGALQAGSIVLDNGSCQAYFGFDSSCNFIVTGMAGNRLLTLDQSGNMTIPGCITVSCIHVNNGTCSTTLAFDGRCYLVVYGSLGVNNNLDVNGLTNLAGDLKVDGSLTLPGPWLTDQNANGHSLYGLQKLEVAQIEFHSGNCTAELQFDAQCNLVLYGNMVASGNLTVGGTLNAAQINQGGSPLDTGVLSVNGLKGDVTLLAGQGINITATSQSITIGLQNLPYPGITVENDITPQRSLDATYQNSWPVPMLVVVSVNLGPNDGVIAYTGPTSALGNQVGVIQSVSQDFTLIMQMTFWVLPGWWYKLDSSLSTNPDWPPFVNKWIEWR